MKMKKILAVILSLAMILPLIPAMSISAFATGSEVAQVGETGYESLAEAIAAAEDGDTVTLLANTALTQIVHVNGGKAITLDLNGNTITATAGSYGASRRVLNVTGNASLTLTDSAEGGAIVVSGSGNTTAVYVDSGASFELAGGTIEVDDVPGPSNWWQNNNVYGVQSNGTTTISGGTVYVHTASTNYAVNCAGGTLEVTGGTIKAGNEQNTGKAPYAIYRTGGSVSVTGGTVEVDDQDTYGWSEGHLVYGTASVTGGTYISTKALDINELAAKVAAGYVLRDNQDGSYAVVVDTSVARIGSTRFETLPAAISAAVDGNTVTLLADVELTQVVQVNGGKAITLDLNGHTITATAGSYGASSRTLNVTGNASLTITDSGEDGAIVVSGTGNNTTAVYVDSGASFELAGGTIEMANVPGGSQWWQSKNAYGVQSSGTTVISGGMVYVHSQSANYAVAVSGGTLSVTGGYIKAGNEQNTGNAPYAIYRTGGTASITGGTVEVDDQDTYGWSEGHLVYGAASVACGTFISTKSLDVTELTAKVVNGSKAVAISEDPYQYQVGYVTVVPETAGDIEGETPVSEVVYTISTVVKESEDELSSELESITDLTVTVTTTETETFNGTEESVAAVSFENIKDNAALAEIVKEAVESVGDSITEATDNVSIEIYVAKSAAATTATAVTYEVHPEALVKVNDAEVGSVNLKNEQLKGSFSFKLYAGDVFAPGTNVKVTHVHSDSTSEVHGIYTVDEDGYITIEGVTSFSEFTLEEITDMGDAAEYGYTLALEDSIDIIFNLKNLAGATSDYRVSYGFTMTKDASWVTVTPTSKAFNSYVISSNAAKEMGKPVYVEVTYKGELIKSASYSVKGYCDYVIDNEFGGTNLQNLCKATLDYGRYAQETFNYNVWELVNGGNDYFVNESISVPPYDADKTGYCEGISGVSMNLSTESNIQLYVNFQYDGTVDPGTYVTSINGNAVQYTVNPNTQKIQVVAEGIAAKNLNEKVTFTIGNGVDTFTFTVSPVDYMGRALEYESQVEVNRAFYNYYTMASAYFAAPTA